MPVAILIPCHNQETMIRHVVCRLFADLEADVYVPGRRFIA